MAINWIKNGKIEMVSEVSTIHGKEEYFTIKMETSTIFICLLGFGEVPKNSRKNPVRAQAVAPLR